MTKKMVSLAVAAVLLTLTMTGSALASCQTKVALSITAAGAAIDASGTAEARAQGSRQRFRVSIDARVADGTTFLVYANGSLAGAITIQLGSGELDLSNADGKALPPGVSPVCGIGTVQVSDGAGTVVLQGNF